MDGVLSQEEINALLNNPGASSDTADGQLSDSEKDTIGEIANISIKPITTAFSIFPFFPCTLSNIFKCSINPPNKE